MNAQVLAVGMCLGFCLVAWLAFEVAVFRVACGLCGVPTPHPAKAIGLVAVLLAVPAVVDGVFSGVLYEVYTATGYPLWEAGVVQFFLALPAHMVICSTIHAHVMRLRWGDAVGVWLVEKCLKLVLFGGLAAVVVAAVALSKAKG